MMKYKTLSVMERLERQKKVCENGCWEWTGTLSGKGYGKIMIKRKTWFVHRLAYQELKGPIEKGMWACHKCDNPKCFNPDHIFIGTPKQNSEDM